MIAAKTTVITIMELIPSPGFCKRHTDLGVLTELEKQEIVNFQWKEKSYIFAVYSGWTKEKHRKEKKGIFCISIFCFIVSVIVWFHHHHGGPSVSRMTLSVPLICGYGSGSAGRSWTCRAVRSLGTGSSHLSLGYRLPSGGVLWRTVLDGDALPLVQMTQIVKVCASAVCPEQ